MSQGSYQPPQQQYPPQQAPPRQYQQQQTYQYNQQQQQYNNQPFQQAYGGAPQQLDRGYPQQGSQATINAGSNGTIVGLDQFRLKVDELMNNCQQIKDGAAQMRQTHQQIDREVNPEVLEGLKQRLEAQTQQCKSLVDSTRRGLDALRSSNGGDAKERQNLFEVTGRQLRSAVQDFRNVEVEIASSQRARFAREYRIVNPQASQQDIDRAMESGGSVFGDALLQGRLDQQRGMLNAAEERKQALLKIQRGMEELLTLTQELDSMVNTQQVWIDQIETKVLETHVQVQEANVQLGTATNYAVAARKKKWIVFWIVLVVLIVIGIAIAIYVVTNKKSDSGNGK
ncbi:Plasma membrane t-SNARE, secretory vesicle fusion [Irineochytrium annulatum]|nr:Plasma membrane t-SNARE, secretory vesicle fusion [Irineochytrium annulatum]